MTWSPFFTLVTPGPTSTTIPAPSWPRIAGNSPSGSSPERVYSSVWQMPVALISTSTSPALGPSSVTVATSSGLPAPNATAARTSMIDLLVGRRRSGGWWRDYNRRQATKVQGEGVMRSVGVSLAAVTIVAVMLAIPAAAQPGTWTLKTPRPDITNEAAAVAIDGKLYAPGGSKQSKSMTRLDEYDPATDRWRARARLPQPLDHLGVAVVNGKLYTAGGLDSTIHQNASDAFLEYDPTTDAWRRLPPLKAPVGAV